MPFYWCSDEVSLLAAKVDWVGLCLALLVLIIAGCGILDGSSVVMASLLGLVKVLLSVPFLNELLGLFRYPAASGRALLAGTLPFPYSAARFCLFDPHLAVTSSWLCC